MLRGLPNRRVHTSKSQVAAALWDYGEDDLADRAIAMSDDELASIQNICAWFEFTPYPLPKDGRTVEPDAPPPGARPTRPIHSVAAAI